MTIETSMSSPRKNKSVEGLGRLRIDSTARVFIVSCAFPMLSKRAPRAANAFVFQAELAISKDLLFQKVVLWI
jgi:hypothetical protein